MFKDKLKEAMETLDLKAAQVSNLTGVGKSSISQYLSGSIEPTKERKETMATALGLPADYFTDENEIKVPSTKRGIIPRLTLAETAGMMGISAQALGNGIRDGAVPWGYAFHGRGDKYVYFINARRFFETERVEGVKL